MKAKIVALLLAAALTAFMVGCDRDDVGANANRNANANMANANMANTNTSPSASPGVVTLGTITGKPE